MGCGASSKVHPEEVAERDRKIKTLESEANSNSDEKAKLKKQVAELEKQVKELGKRKSSAVPEKETNPTDNKSQFTIQVVISRTTIETLQKTFPKVEIVLVNASTDYTEVPVNLTGTAADLQNVLPLCDKGIAEVPILPGPIEEEVVAETVELNENEVKEESTTDAEKNEASEAVKSAFKCKSCVDVAPNWDGSVTLVFEWVDWSTPFSEYLNPSGSNWRGSVLQAPNKTPQDFKVEWRQGVGDSWHVIDAPNGKATLTIKPPEVSTINYNGFQSRWRIDDELYLSPLERAPTLIGKLMNYPTVRNAWKALPPDKRNIENLPEQLQKPISSMEDLIPMSTWDIGYGIVQVPGLFIDGKHVMGALERASHVAKEKIVDPKIQSTLRGEALKAPINIMSAALGTVGVKLDVVVKNLDFFVPKMMELDFESYDKLVESDAMFEQNRREIQADINTMYPQYQKGLRVACPTSQDMKNVLKTKRPTIEAKSTIPVEFKHIFSNSEQYEKQAEVSVTVWSLASPNDKQTLKLEAKETEEKEGLLSSKMKPVWKEYTVTHNLESGDYGYTWTIDGEAYCDEAKPVAANTDCYSKLRVIYGVRFGVGVKMP